MPRGGKRAGAGRRPGATGPQKKTLAIRRRIRKREDLSADATLRRLADGADWDPLYFFDDKGNFRKVSDIPYRERKALVGVEMLRRNVEAGDGHTDLVLKLVWAKDRSRYVEMAAKHAGLLVEKVDVTDNVVTLLERVARARARLAKASE